MPLRIFQNVLFPNQKILFYFKTAMSNKTHKSYNFDPRWKLLSFYITVFVNVKSDFYSKLILSNIFSYLCNIIFINYLDTTVLKKLLSIKVCFKPRFLFVLFYIA